MSKELVIQGGVLWDPVKEVFVNVKPQTIVLEHSLLSIRKWESKWKVNYIDNRDVTDEMATDYIRCMTITKNVDPFIYTLLSTEQMKEIADYINDKMTATFFGKRDKDSNGRKRVITCELIYCWMTQCQIPFECERWHLNQLLTLIEVCSEENKPQKKGKNDAASRAARQAEMTRRRKLQGI